MASETIGEAIFDLPPPPPSRGGQPAPARPTYPPAPEELSWSERGWRCRLGLHRWRTMCDRLGINLRHCTRCGERHPDTYR